MGVCSQERNKNAFSSDSSLMWTSKLRKQADILNSSLDVNSEFKRALFFSDFDILNYLWMQHHAIIWWRSLSAQHRCHSQQWIMYSMSENVQELNSCLPRDWVSSVRLVMWPHSTQSTNMWSVHLMEVYIILNIFFQRYLSLIYVWNNTECTFTFKHLDYLL